MQVKGGSGGSMHGTQKKQTSTQTQSHEGTVDADDLSSVSALSAVRVMHTCTKAFVQS